jgi:hypothetical protein
MVVVTVVVMVTIVVVAIVMTIVMIFRWWQWWFDTDGDCDDDGDSHGGGGWSWWGGSWLRWWWQWYMKNKEEQHRLAFPEHGTVTMQPWCRLVPLPSAINDTAPTPLPDPITSTLGSSASRIVRHKLVFFMNFPGVVFCCSSTKWMR